MHRYIDADQFEVFYYEKTEDREDTFDDGVLYVLEKIDEAPTEDVAPIIHAKWEADPEDLFGPLVICSNCGKKVYDMDVDKISYCPYCGA